MARNCVSTAIQIVDLLGYNSIDSTVVNYQFLENKTKKIFDAIRFEENSFSFGLRPGHFQQINIWKRTPFLTLADSGGHRALKEGWIFPLKFIKLHYPLRSLEHAERKIFIDRLPRFKLENKLYGWHTQYNDVSNISNIGSNNYCFQINKQFFENYLVERLSGIGIREDDNKSFLTQETSNDLKECKKNDQYEREITILRTQLNKITSAKIYKVWQFYCSIRKQIFRFIKNLLRF